MIEFIEEIPRPEPERLSVKLFFQHPPYEHWALSIWVSDHRGVVKLRALFTEFKDRAAPPPREEIKELTEQLTRMGRIALGD